MEVLQRYLRIAIRFVLVLGLCALISPLTTDFVIGPERTRVWLMFDFFFSFGVAMALAGWVWPEKCSIHD